MMDHPEAGSHVLGIDLGSTWCKAAYLDPDGHVLAHGRADTRGLPAFGFGADDLEDVWAAVRQAVGEASAHLRAAGGRPVPAGLALSSRHGSGLWLDARGRPLGPVSELPPQALREATAAVYGDPAWDDESLCSYAQVLVSRTLCLRRSRRDLWGRVRWVGALHDGLLLRLTGRWITNPATGPGWPGWPGWPRAAGLLCGLPMAAFPAVLAFGALAGPLVAAAARDLDLPPATPVAAGYHDGAAATVGVGCLQAGDACITLGTSAALRVVAHRPARGWFGYPISEDRWAWMRGVGRALADVDAVAEVLGAAGAAPGARHATLTEEARAVPPGARGLSLPIGEPGQDVRAAASAARDAGHAAGVIYRAALEGVALRIRGLAGLARQAGVAPRRYVATGGAAHNDLLLGILSGALAQPVGRGEAEAGVRGAALAAAVVAGWYPTIASAACRICAAPEPIVAGARESEAYAAIAAPVPVMSETLPFWRCLPT
jgi:sugar (pentulose or hexulose) kinase